MDQVRPLVATVASCVWRQTVTSCAAC
jgi:hypothetical protein